MRSCGFAGINLSEMYLILCGLGFENNETNIMFDVHFQLTVLNILTKVMHSLVNEETERSEETI